MRVGVRPWWLRLSGGDDDGRRKITSVVNCDPWRSIYKGPTGPTHCGFFYCSETTATALC
jgi:hypothetical protein